MNHPTGKYRSDEIHEAANFGSDMSSVIAIHEAGHVAMAWLMEIPIVSVVLDGMDSHINLNRFALAIRPKSKLNSWEFVQGYIRMLLAGRCAERIFFGFSGGGHGDGLHADELAKVFGKDVANIEKETHAILFTHKDVIRRVAETLEQKKKLSSRDLAAMQEEFTRGGEQLCPAT